MYRTLYVQGYNSIGAYSYQQIPKRPPLIGPLYRGYSI
jgi:hypothetical protein